MPRPWLRLLVGYGVVVAVLERSHRYKQYSYYYPIKAVIADAPIQVVLVLLQHDCTVYVWYGSSSNFEYAGYAVQRTGYNIIIVIVIVIVIIIIIIIIMVVLYNANKNKL